MTIPAALEVLWNVAENEVMDAQEVSRAHQISLRTLIEMLTISSIALAALHLQDLLTAALICALLAVWSIRVPDWAMRVSLMMLFSGVCALALGLFFVVFAFQLAATIIPGNRVPDLLVTLGPLVALVGLFYSVFGFCHLIITWRSIQ